MHANDSTISIPFYKPLAFSAFRNIWLAGLLLHFGQLIQTVGATWTMAEISSNAIMVALVQTAAMAPVMLFALSTGAIADTFDRRRVVLIGLLLTLCGASAFTVSALAGKLSPSLILLFTFVIGSGVALFSPAWQASVTEQVPPDVVPSAVALNSICFNFARSLGPTIGGLIVAFGGAALAFLTHAILILPIVFVFLLWKRVHAPTRFPPEQFNRAVISGVRYVLNSRGLRVILVRSLLVGILGSVLSALMPLIARIQLKGDASIYGLILGAYGLGAVLGALCVSPLRARFQSEAVVRFFTMLMAAMLFVVASSHSVTLVAFALIVAGACLMISVTMFHVGMQTASPRWVAGRTLALFQAATAGGIAIGSWVWGTLVQSYDTGFSMLVAGIGMFCSSFIGIWLELPQSTGIVTESGVVSDDPAVELAISDRSGPIVIEVQYRVRPELARSFYSVMQEIQQVRQRNGAYGWSLARDVSDVELWTERYHCPTWLDYLRQRNRPTKSEQELNRLAFDYHKGPEKPRIRRMLERPFGSVRHRDDVKYNAASPVIPAQTGGT